MKFKDGVFTRVTVIKDGIETVLKPSANILSAMNIADKVSKKIAGIECWITSILDGTHMEGSKHYKGDAFDMRKNCYKKEMQLTIFTVLKQELGIDYDVVNESTHFHIEYDPK